MSSRIPGWLLVVFTISVLMTLSIVAGVIDARISRPAPEPLPPPIEEPEPQVWRGRVECVYGNTMMYSVDNLVDFIVTAQPGGWMWEMFREDGTVIFYHQPKRTFCSAIPEE